MRVLVACEFSQVVCKAFRDRGHEAYSCDILPTEGNPDWHIQDDVLHHLHDNWDIMIAHPDCTYLANSGVRWLNKERWVLMLESCDFFNTLLYAPIPKIVIENPIQHKYARKFIRKYDQIIQPYQFGEDASKSTCLWLVNLPPLLPTLHIVKKIYSNQTPSGQNKLPPSAHRKADRARTYPGIAKAMAEQWGSLTPNQ